MACDLARPVPEMAIGSVDPTPETVPARVKQASVAGAEAAAKDKKIDSENPGMNLSPD